MPKRILRVLFRARRAILLTCIGTWVLAAVATHLPAPEVSGIHVSDKLLHFAGFLVLASLFWLSLLAYAAPVHRRVPTVLIVMILYALVDETTQSFVRRTPEVGDWLADVMGTVTAVLAWEVIATALRLGPTHRLPGPPTL
jgi:VanZ family protein